MDHQANLGLATTRQLLEELEARSRITMKDGDGVGHMCRGWLNLLPSEDLDYWTAQPTRVTEDFDQDCTRPQEVVHYLTIEHGMSRSDAESLVEENYDTVEKGISFRSHTSFIGDQLWETTRA